MNENKPIGTIRGSIACGSSLNGTISAAVSSSPEVEIYEGEYEVTPEIKKSQTLHTAKKYLQKDITVHAVPYSEISNTSNGITAYIGKEV